MSKSTFRILFYVRKNQINKESKASIIIRLAINGDTSQFSSKMEVEPNFWDVKGQVLATFRKHNEDVRKLVDMNIQRTNNFLSPLRGAI